MSDNGPDDFTATGRAGDDELLPGSGPQGPLRRLRGDILVAIVVLAAAGFLLKALTGGHSTHPAPPSTSASGSVSLTGPPPRGVFTFGPGNSEGLVPAAPCPVSARCVTTRALPGPFAAALRLAYPHVVVDTVAMRTLPGAGLSRGGLWSRMVAAHDRHDFVVIIVSRNGPAGSKGDDTQNSGQRTIYVRVQRGPYTVQVEAIGLPGSTTSLGRITTLAGDPRLLQSG